MIDQYSDIFDSVYDLTKKNIDQVLQELKKAGASQMQSAMVLMRKLGLSIAEADRIVVDSVVWQENKAMIEKFRVEFGDYLESLD